MLRLIAWASREITHCQPIHRQYRISSSEIQIVVNTPNRLTIMNKYGSKGTVSYQWTQHFAGTQTYKERGLELQIYVIFFTVEFWALSNSPGLLIKCLVFIQFEF